MKDLIKYKMKHRIHLFNNIDVTPMMLHLNCWTGSAGKLIYKLGPWKHLTLILSSVTKMNLQFYLMCLLSVVCYAAPTTKPTYRRITFPSKLPKSKRLSKRASRISMIIRQIALILDFCSYKTNIEVINVKNTVMWLCKR